MENSIESTGSGFAASHTMTEVDAIGQHVPRHGLLLNCTHGVNNAGLVAPLSQSNLIAAPLGERMSSLLTLDAVTRHDERSDSSVRGVTPDASRGESTSMTTLLTDIQKKKGT